MKWDKEYWAVCVAYRLLSRGRIGKQKAIDILEKRAKVRNAINTVEVWQRIKRHE